MPYIRMKLPVPPGFIITTDSFVEFVKEGSILCSDVRGTIEKAVHHIESEHHVSFGATSLKSSPLLFSVRCGSSVLMPGITKTILNVGMNDAAVKGLTELSSNAIFPLNAFIAYLESYGTILLIPHACFAIFLI